MRDLDPAPGAALDLFLVALQHVEGAAADGADAEQADLDRFHRRDVQAGRSIARAACGSASRKRAMRPIASRRSSELGRKTMRKWSGVRPVEAGALHDQHLLLGQQLVGELLVVVDRVIFGSSRGNM